MEKSCFSDENTIVVLTSVMFIEQSFVCQAIIRDIDCYA